MERENPKLLLRPEQVAQLKAVYLEALAKGKVVDAREKGRETNFLLRLAKAGEVELSMAQLWLLCQMILTRMPDAVLPEFVHQTFKQQSITRQKRRETRL